jgi:hypothetical protein
MSSVPIAWASPKTNILRSTKGVSLRIQRALEGFGPGKTISTALMAVKDEIEARGLAICEAGIHGHGLASLEYPRFRHHAIAADREAIKVIGDRFEPGMVSAFNIDLLNPKWRQGKTGCVFAETIEITATGARRMHTFPTEFQRVDQRDLRPSHQVHPGILLACFSSDATHQEWRTPLAGRFRARTSCVIRR